MSARATGNPAHPHLFVTLPPVDPAYISLSSVSAGFALVVRAFSVFKTTLDRLGNFR
jgi:hypothetical protein